LKRTLRILGVVFGTSCVMATAMPALADDLAGDWKFETSTFEGDCMIKGVMHFKKTQLTNTYACTFESEQICGKLNSNLYIKVNQSCTAQKVGKQVAVKSKVVSVAERRPEIPNPMDYYLADNFVVAFQKNMNEMLGDHYDEVRQLKARFWRDIDLIA
jgi:capsular polysaccharide biosynthesis protein